MQLEKLLSVKEETEASLKSWITQLEEVEKIIQQAQQRAQAAARQIDMHNGKLAGLNDAIAILESGSKEPDSNAA